MTDYTNRLAGVSSSVAVKAPVRVATTANITLAGLQTIDGLTLVDKDRVLVKNQTDGTQNGIYVAATGDWSRALDFDGARDIVQGTAVRVVAGDSSAGVDFFVSTADPVIGTTTINFSQDGVNASRKEYATVTALQADSLDYSFFFSGDYIRTLEGGHVYKVAASDATDHDLTTAGGVRLYVQPMADGFYSLDAFNPASDDATAAYEAATAKGSVDLGAKTYILDNASTGVNAKHIRGIRGATELKVKDGATGNPLLIEISGKSNVRFEGININGNADNIANFNNVITTFNCTNIVFDRVKWFDCEGIASIVSGGTRVKHLECEFEDCGILNRTTATSSDRKQAIAYTGSTFGHVHGCHFHNVGLDVISFATGSHDFKCTFNRVWDNDAGALYFSTSDRGVIQGNRVRNAYTDSDGGNGIDINQCDDLTISGNVAEDCGAAGIMIADSTNIALSANLTKNCFQGGTSTHQGGLTISSTSAGSVKNITVTGHISYDDQGAGNVTQRYALGITTTGGGTYANVKVDNSCIFTGYDGSGNVDPGSIFQSRPEGLELETITPQFFGARGDGATEDTAAINAAIEFANLASGGEVFFPAGTYPAEGLRFFGDITYRGEGRFNTVLKLKDSASNVLAASERWLDNDANPGEQIHIYDIGFDGNGDLDTAALATFCSGTDGFVKVWYDQAGANDATQTTTGSQPKIYDSLTGVITDSGKPVIESDADDILNTNITGNSTAWVFAALKGGQIKHTLLESTGSTQYVAFARQGNINDSWSLPSSPNYYLDGSAISAPSRDEMYSYTLTRRVLSIDFDSSNYDKYFIGRPDLSVPMYSFHELIVYHSNQSSNRTGIESNINTYYSIYP